MNLLNNTIIILAARSTHEGVGGNFTASLIFVCFDSSEFVINYYYLLQVIYKAKQPVTPDQQVKKYK